MPPQACWRLTPGQHLSYRCWDGECVLYNDLTGDTHLVDEFALDLLQMLRAGPLPAAGLAVALGAGDGAPPPPADVLQAVLADLAALHLIEAAPC